MLAWTEWMKTDRMFQYSDMSAACDRLSYFVNEMLI